MAFPFPFPQEPRQEQQRREAMRATTQPQRRQQTARGVDHGTVALALSGMSYYWLMPMLAGRRRKRRANRPSTEQQQ